MKRKVTVSYIDNDSLSSTELEANLKSVYGPDASIQIQPGTNLPQAYIRFAISELITDKQCLLFFDSPELYPEKLKTLRREVIREFLYILNDVIMENEKSFSGEE